MERKLESEIKIQRATNDLLELMPQFIYEWYVDMKKSGIATSSCYEYLRKIRGFLEYISDDIKNMNAEEITCQACESYYIYCQLKKEDNGMEVPTSNSYRQILWSVLNNLVKFLVKANYIENNFMGNIDRPKDKDNTRKIRLTKNDFNKILLAAKDPNNYMHGMLNNRDALIVLLFMTTGIKKTSMSEINMENIDRENKTLSIIDRNNTAHMYDLSDQIIEHLDEWLKDRTKFETSDSKNALFISKDGFRLGDDAIYNIVKRCCYKGIGKKLSPHSLRSGFCTILYQKTHDVEFVTNAVGFAHKQTTLRYIKNKGGERKKSMEIMSNIFNA